MVPHRRLRSTPTKWRARILRPQEGLPPPTRREHRKRRTRAAINGHPAVIESAVHAVASDLGEDDIKVCIVARDPIEPAELFDYFKSTLPYFAIPRYVEFLEELPRNAVGRVLKHSLREAGNGANTWDFEAMALTVAKQERR